MAVAITMRPALFRVAVALLVLLPATPGRAFSDAELINGFERTVFGSEYPSWSAQSNIVKKFAKPVRLYVDDRSKSGRGAEVASFARSLPGQIRGLKLSVVSSPAKANFRVFVVDRTSYRAVVAREVYGRPSSSFAPGKCLVRVISTSAGIVRSDAVVVADEGDFLFRRCMVEEVLQGLGPVNDDRTLPESVFNDTSRHRAFTGFDRHLMSMLYHPSIRPGMGLAEAGRALPTVAKEVQARLR